MVLYVRNSTILARHFWNCFPSKPVTMGIKNSDIYLSNQYKHLRYTNEHIILNKLDLFMNDMILSESTSVSYCHANRYNIHYKLQINNGECHEKKLYDISSIENLDLWHEIDDVKKIKQIDDLIQTNKPCFVYMKK
jgi:hypothetical protein